MTTVHIGKRKALPELCPTCGQTQLPPEKYKGNVLSALLANTYTYWHAEPRQTWGGVQWYGVCGSCHMVGALTARSSFLDNIKKDANFQGGTFVVPFSKR